MLRETQILVEGVQKHWLVREYIQNPDITAMQAPVPVSGEGVKP